MSDKPLQDWEIKSLREIHDKWYETFYSLVFTPTGEIPHVRGKFTEGDQVIEMADHLRKEYSDDEGLTIIVVSSRCGDINAEDYDEWFEMRKIGIECAEAEAEYIKAGICSGCGACSLKEAETKCRPTPLADTGDYTCDGERLWEDQREQGDNEDPESHHDSAR